jgi:hypothetical protein
MGVNCGMVKIKGSWNEGQPY